MTLTRISQCDTCGAPQFAGCDGPSCYCAWRRDRGQPCRSHPSGGTHPLSTVDAPERHEGDTLT
jgi:hypothetical protein